MASVNKAIIVGNLGRDPDLRYMPNGEAVCNFSVATTSSWKDKDGNKKEDTQWHNIVLYKRLAEIAGEYLKKGRSVYLEGELRTRKWEKDGVTRYTTEIVCQTMQMLGGGSPAEDAARGQSSGSTTQSSEQTEKPAGGNFDNFEDDIPF